MVEYLLPWKQKWRTLLFVRKGGNKGNVITFAYSCTKKMWKGSHIAHEGGGLGLEKRGTEKGKGGNSYSRAVWAYQPCECFTCYVKRKISNRA